MKIALDELRCIVEGKLSRGGWSEEEAARIAEVLLWAEKRGNSQGIVKLTGGFPMVRGDSKEPEITRDRGLAAVIDAHGYSGILSMRFALDVALEKARTSGMSVISCHGVCSGTGALGWYVEQAAKEGFVSLVMCQSPELVAPFGAAEAFFGTNPIAVGFPLPPRDGEPPAVVIDVATSEVAYYDVIAWDKAGVEAPEGAGIGPDGQPTRDPAQILRGAINVLGGNAKGSALACAVELLTGAVAGGAVEGKFGAKDWGNLIICIDPTLFSEREEYDERVQRAVDRLHVLRPADPERPVLFPGERGFRKAKEVEEAGGLDIRDALLDALRSD